MTLRPYQVEAVEAVYHYLRGHDDNPCVVCPTGAGKSLIIARICRDAVVQWNGRVLILAHVKELLEQARDKLDGVCPDLHVGIYSAGLKRRDTSHPVIIAGIQSIYQKAENLGHFDLVIVDEAHMIPMSGDGMYRRLLGDMRLINPHLRVIGLTATPFRMASGPICVTPPEGILNAICYEIGVRELIRDGYLSPLKSKAGRCKADFQGLHVRGGEFVADEVEKLMDQDSLVHSACREIVDSMRLGGRKACLVFASGVEHGKHVTEIIGQVSKVECGFIDGQTPSLYRDELIRRFRDGDLAYLVNVNVLTTGFDAPNVDCVALLRPTMSPGLYYQMCLDMETEVLTPIGWARHDQVHVGDTVGAFDLATGQIVFCQAQDKVHRPLAPGESLYGVTAPHLDIRVTDQHVMVYRGRSKSCLHWRRREARDLVRHKTSFRVPVAGTGDGPGLPLTDDELRFLGWFFTDGHRNPANNTIAIAQSAASPHLAAIEATLRGCGFGYRVYRHARTGKLTGYPDGLLFVIPYGKPRGQSRHLRGWRRLADYFNRPLLETLSPISRRQLGIVLEAMNLGDGRKPRNLPYSKRTFDLCIGNHKFLADQLQALFILRGFRCNIAVQLQKTSWHKYEPKPQYILHVRDQQTATIGGALNRGNALVQHRCRFGPLPFDPTEQVWCLTTEHGTLVTRRRGKVAITGNCGRGFRPHPGKTDCLVLDFGGNVMRHGPVDAIRITDAPSKGTGEAPVKECPQCQALIAMGYATCPECGYEFPPPERNAHEATADASGILTGQVTINEYEVRNVYYCVHVKRGAPPDAPRTMRIDYEIGYLQQQSEWVCIEHPRGGYARQKAEAWWRMRSNAPMPDNVDDAVDLANAGAVAETLSIKVRSVAGEKYDRIVDYELGPKPDTVDSGFPASTPSHEVSEYVPADDDIPF